MGRLCKVTQRHFLYREAAALDYHTAVICPQSSNHFSRMTCRATVCTSGSSERTTSLDVELMSCAEAEAGVRDGSTLKSAPWP